MTPDVAGRVRRTAAVCFAALAGLALASAYWGIARAGELAARPDNPRRIAFDQRIQRGRLLDRHGAELAATEFTAEGPGRRYRVPAAAPVTGFQAWRYGAGATGASYGAAGAEAAYDAALRGDLGLSLRELVTLRLLHRDQAGNDVRLTLDAGLQTAAAELLGDREGAVVVVDVKTGAVRALVSQPTFDPAALDSGAYTADDPERRMFNRATQGLYTPGSVWKTVTLAAALREGLARPADVFDDGDAVESFDGYEVACNNNPPEIVSFDLAHAFAWSCNVTFARLAHSLGADRLRAYAESFGLGEAPPFALPTAAGSLSADGELAGPELAADGFGQGELQVTPLQMALVTAAVAGDGRLPTPYLLEEVDGASARGLHEARGPWRRAIDSGTARTVRDIMVTSARDGWARAANPGDLSFGGKTGTAEVPDGPPHAWFIGFAPADEPEVAVAVLVVHGGQGAVAAAPIGGRILAQALAAEAQ